MNKGDKLICAFPEPKKVGETFTRWPLHVTIIPWFQVTADEAEFERLLQEQLGEIPAFGAKVRYPRKFGFRQANVLLKNQWQPIHDAALACVSQAAKSTVRFRFVGRWYSPHVTYQGEEHLQEGDIFWCDRVYIIEQKVEHKEVVAALELNSEK
jgi:hypothetical protein